LVSFVPKIINGVYYARHMPRVSAEKISRGGAIEKARRKNGNNKPPSTLSVAGIRCRTGAYTQGLPQGNASSRISRKK